MSLRTIKEHTTIRTRMERAIVILLLTTVAIALVAAPILAWRWSREPFLGTLLEPTLLLSPFSGPGWARAETDPPLESLSLLTAIDDQPVARRADVEAALADRKVGQQVTLTITNEDGRTRRESIPLAIFPTRAGVLLFLFPYVTGVACLVIGSWVYWLQGQNQSGRVFAGMCACMALMMGILFELNTTHHLAVLWCASVPFVAATGIHLAVIFPQRLSLIKRLPILQLLPYLPATLFAARAILSVYDSAHPWAHLDHWYVSYLFAVVAIIHLLGTFAYHLIRPTSTLVRQQSRIVLLGAALALLPVVPWVLLIVWGSPIPFPTHIYAPLFVLCPLSIAYAIARYRLLTIDRLFSYAVAYGALTMLVITSYLLIIDGLDQYLSIDTSDPLVLAVFILALTLLFNPLRSLIQSLVNRLFFRDALDYHATLQHFSRELTGTLDLQAVLTSVGKQIKQSLHPARQWICLYDEDMACYIGQPIGERQHAMFPVTFTPDGPLACWLRDHQECLYLPAARGLPDDLADEWVQMGALGAVIYTPLRARERLIGWLAIGPKRSGQPHRSDDLAFLGALADQSALAIENARLFTSVRRNLATSTEIKNLMDDVFSSIPSGVITTNIKDKVTLFNSAAESILGIKAKDVVGTHCQQVLDQLWKDLPSLVRKVKRSDTSVVDVEMQAKLPTRGSVWLRLSVTPLKDSRDVTTGVTIVVDDLTEQRELEARARLIQNTFQRYVAPAVVERLISNPDSVRLGGVRQEITSFYADIRGFTAFSENTEPEMQIEVLNRHLTLAVEAIIEQEGTLDKFVGDAVMAIYNAPEPQEDHTLRAVRAALTMQQFMRGHHTLVRENEQLHFGIGITVGEAVVGNIGSSAYQRNFTAIGNCVNFSSRLSDMADAGQILLSKKAYQRVADKVETRFIGDVQIRGHSQPDPIYEVTSLKPEAPLPPQG